MTRTSEYEALNADQLIAERKGREQWLDELPKSSFSKELTAMILEANEFVEDSLVVDQAEVDPDSDHSSEVLVPCP